MEGAGSLGFELAQQEIHEGLGFRELPFFGFEVLLKARHVALFAIKQAQVGHEAGGRGLACSADFLQVVFHAFGLIDGCLECEVTSAVGEAIGGYIQDAHHQRTPTEFQGSSS